uniref:Uncharacterized protein n=1 Tax=Mustela putorius furo TaxID=9669 RepID=M3YYZ3_MUSPF
MEDFFQRNRGHAARDGFALGMDTSLRVFQPRARPHQPRVGFSPGPSPPPHGACPGGTDGSSWFHLHQGCLLQDGARTTQRNACCLPLHPPAAPSSLAGLQSSKERRLSCQRASCQECQVLVAVFLNCVFWINIFHSA